MLAEFFGRSSLQEAGFVSFLKQPDVKFMQKCYLYWQQFCQFCLYSYCTALKDVPGLKTVYTRFHRYNMQCYLKQGTFACDNFAFDGILLLLFSSKAEMTLFSTLESLHRVVMCCKSGSATCSLINLFIDY